MADKKKSKGDVSTEAESSLEPVQQQAVEVTHDQAKKPRKPVKELTNAQKAAAIIVSLGAEKASLIYKHMIDSNWVSRDYLDSSLPAERVRDFLAGMTDRYFENVFKNITNPKRVNYFNEEKIRL